MVTNYSKISEAKTEGVYYSLTYHVFCVLAGGFFFYNCPHSGTWDDKVATKWNIDD